MRERIGIFGGTFDPPHVGHLVSAVNVVHALKLDRLLLVVANRPWQKVGSRTLTSAEHRFGMTKSAVEGHAGLEASDIEISRGGNSYTIDTLRELQRAGAEELFVVLGSDAAQSLPSWDRSEELCELAKVVVVDRPGATGKTPPPGWDWFSVEAPRLEVSSSDIRARVVDGRPLDYLLTTPVISYIREHGIYDL